MIDEPKIREKLKTVIDPEIGINIVDLGLVYGVEINDSEITITMTLTTPGCPMHNSIMRWVEKEVQTLDSTRRVVVNLVWEPRWTPMHMSREAKELLGI